MNLLTGIIATVFAWVVFSTLNQLKIAGDKGGCCRDGSCGKGKIDNLLFYSNLTIAVVLTLGVLFGILEKSTSPGTRLPTGHKLPDILGMF